ncbi:hypothetical protein J7E97_22565 [Streptomyces sp. ISL-66]|uniref:hypothetical protein n=1 Tax=Streptomyces sp. ISL-66 TaxID=2819186 RepID=UPI001BE588AF|nr:hypothetical protein [Streptomyces sp. ISL-66]MBT2470574.1 hypothetical protein [Streptomyces sp. ISL-66]
MSTAVCTELTNTSGWSAPAIPWPCAKTPSAPALATHNGKLYCAVRGGDNIHLCNTTATGWNTFAPVTAAGKTLSAPALAASDSDLHLVCRAPLYSATGLSKQGPSRPIARSGRFLFPRRACFLRR